MNFGFMQLIGVAFVASAICVPLAYCEMEGRKAEEETRKACIEAKGNWEPYRGGYCHVPR